MKQKPPKTILVIDDDGFFRKLMQDFFSTEDFKVLTAETAREGLEYCRNHRVDIVLLDENLPDGEGHLLCPSILETNEDSKIIFITAFPSFDHAVMALKAGAQDYLSKPFELEELQLAVTRAARTLDLEKSRSLLTYKTSKEREPFVPIGESVDGGRVNQLIRLAGEASSPVLITGETGTGKGVIARAIHNNGSRAGEPFIPINCAAIPENLMEAEIFGSEKGAFTGAVSTRKGIFELADGGTLFLDEIGAMPLHLQSKLLGALEDGQIKRIGGQAFIPVNVRIIAATNADLEDMIKSNTFRSDLFYRIGVLRIHLPALRERRVDIPALCGHFMKRLAEGGEASLEESEVLALQQYSWPGNIRELRNILERSLLLHRSRLRPSELIRLDSHSATAPPPATSADQGISTLEEMSREHVRRALERFAGNRTHTAGALGISISTLKRKIREWGLD